MTRYLPYTIYLNLMKFLEYRNLKFLGNVIKGNSKDNSNVLTESKFIEIIQIDHYITIAAEDMSARRFSIYTHPATHKHITYTYIIIIEPDGPASTTSSSFERMIKNIPHMSSSKKNFNIEILVISKELLKTNIEKKLTPMITHGSETEGFVYIHNYMYRVFSMIIPEHILIPKHRILNVEETSLVLKELNAKKSDLPKILRSDPNAIWLGAVIGDVLEIIQHSESTGGDIIYRVCI
jgi:DNA-directed RNA polymerase subunit H (RpoH/RPB5)